MNATPPPLRVAVAGAAGRMGRSLVEALGRADDMALVGALEHAGSAALGLPAAGFLGDATSAAITEDMATALDGAAYLIDFTRPEATLMHVEACIERGIAMVIGTTGFSTEGVQRLRAAAEHIGIVFAPNMSAGVNVAFRLVELAAKALGEGFDVEVIEVHHRHKVDAPSGTALRLGEIAARALGVDISTQGVFARQGQVGARPERSIGFASVRGGDIVGDHTVLFAGAGERIEITHRANSRMTYAEGSLRAVRFLSRAGTGLYDMQDVLGLN